VLLVEDIGPIFHPLIAVINFHDNKKTSVTSKLIEELFHAKIQLNVYRFALRWTTQSACQPWKADGG
jgi:hypothetical protein